jgi:predicted RNase H-like HicB family nuclease
MRIYTAVIEKCMDTGLYVGFVPGFSGAHSQGETLDELNDNLKEVIALLLSEGHLPDHRRVHPQSLILDRASWEFSGSR